MTHATDKPTTKNLTKTVYLTPDPSGKPGSYRSVGDPAAAKEIAEHAKEFEKEEIKLATGRVMRQLASNIPVAWTRSAIHKLTERERSERKERQWIVRLSKKEITFQPDLAELADLIDPDDEGVIAALARALPDWYTLKIIDACHTLALADPEQDGGFWYHPARIADLLGLRGQRVRGQRYYTTAERLRFRKRLQNLMRLQVQVFLQTTTHRKGKGKRVSTVRCVKMFLLSPDLAAGTKRITLHGSGRGRPANAERIKVAAVTWSESRRFHIRLTGTARKLYALQDGSTYKVARYVLTRARMGNGGRGKLEITEPLENVERYAGLPEREIRKAVPKLYKELGIKAKVNMQGRLTARIPTGAVRLPVLAQDKKAHPAGRGRSRD